MSGEDRVNAPALASSGIVLGGILVLAAVVYGHSHKPSIETRDGVLWLNPGSAGPRRFRLPISLGRLRIQEGKITAKLVELGIQTQ